MRTKRNPVRTANFSPPTLTILGAVFDTVWASVARNFGGHPGETEIVRIRLVAIVFELVRDGQLGPHQIAPTASRLIREGHIE